MCNFALLDALILKFPHVAALQDGMLVDRILQATDQPGALDAFAS